MPFRVQTLLIYVFKSPRSNYFFHTFKFSFALGIFQTRWFLGNLVIPTKFPHNTRLSFDSLYPFSTTINAEATLCDRCDEKKITRPQFDRHGPHEIKYFSHRHYPMVFHLA